MTTNPPPSSDLNTQEKSLVFQLKGTKKKKTIVTNENTDDVDETEQRSKILIIENSKIITDSVTNEPAPLVIPLPPPRNQQYNPSSKTEDSSKNKETSSSNTTRDTKSLDELAVEELLSELHNKPVKAESTLVIAASEPSKNNTTGKQAPLLLANLAPELLGIEDDSERFKVDIATRPDNVDVRSNAYNAVPIEEFGAAMLRGMINSVLLLFL